MYRLVFMFILGGIFLPGMAQQPKANWKQVEKFDALVRNFKNDMSMFPRFINETDKFWYRLRTSEGVKYYLVDPDRNKQTELFDMDKMLIRLAEITHKAYNSLDLAHIQINFAKDGKSFSFSHDGHKFNYNLETRRVVEEPKKKEKEEDGVPSGHVLSPDSSYYIYAYRHNLYMYGNKQKGMDTTVVQLTKDGERYNSYAKYPDEGEDEESYPAGRWLKNSRFFMAEIDDERKIGEMHLVDMLQEPRPKLKSYHYSCPGDTTISQYGFKLIDIKTKEMKTIWAEKWKDQYVEYSNDNTRNGS